MLSAKVKFPKLSTSSQQLVSPFATYNFPTFIDTIQSEESTKLERYMLPRLNEDDELLLFLDNPAPQRNTPVQKTLLNLRPDELALPTIGSSSLKVDPDTKDGLDLNLGLSATISRKDISDLEWSHSSSESSPKSPFSPKNGAYSPEEDNLKTSYKMEKDKNVNGIGEGSKTNYRSMFTCLRLT